ncbi:MAG: HAMP domain-containing sensor histidine kinase [Verrucomicrobiota bacterium]
MRRRIRSVITWLGLIGSALLMAVLAVWLLYVESERQKMNETRFLEGESERLKTRLLEYFREIQLETGRQLTAFHEEGLSNQLRRWQGANLLIGGAEVVGPGMAADWYFSEEDAVIDLDSAETPSVLRGGYYSENKEFTEYEGLSVAPVIAWKLQELQSGETWSVAHRLGPQSGTRVGVINRDELIEAFSQLLGELSGSGLSAEIETVDSKMNNALRVPLEELLPGRTLVLRPESPVSDRAWLTTFGYGMVALSFVLCGCSAWLISRQATRERREALRKTTFVSQISHEFKTPLTSIGLYADLMSADDLSKEKRHKYLDTIGRESQRLTDLIDNLLALSSLEQGRKSYRITLTNVGALIDQVVSDYGYALSKDGMSVRWNKGESERTAKIDGAVLRQVLVNILDNARKYAAEGKEVSIDLTQNGERTVIRVADRGPGIASKLKHRIFESFYQEKTQLADKSPGVGLGLSISRKMMRDCGGDLSLDLDYKNGARFLISLAI